KGRHKASKTRERRQKKRRIASLFLIPAHETPETKFGIIQPPIKYAAARHAPVGFITEPE
ncbi:MAG TPA: hypothetical protein PKW59_14805, partial [Thermotogota bacterium]|nr:hypothetical protein [Thermotogota bacterium]